MLITQTDTASLPAVILFQMQDLMKGYKVMQLLKQWRHKSIDFKLSGKFLCEHYASA